MANVSSETNLDVFDFFDQDFSYLSSVFSGLLDMFDSDICIYPTALLSLPRSDPRRPLFTQRLAMARYGRFYFTNLDKDGLEQSILGFTELVLLPRPRDDTCLLNVVEIFSLITMAMSFRVDESRQPEDVKSCIMYFRYLREQGGHAACTRFPVVEILVHLLMVQTGLGLGDVYQDIEEMAVLCDELLNSDDWIPTLPILIRDFAKVVDYHLRGQLGWQSPSNKAIDCLRNASMRLPDLHQVPFVLARLLQIRFSMAPSDNDYKEGMAIFRNIITSCTAGGRPSPYRDMALKWAAILETARFYVCGKPEHLEQAISLFRSWIDVARDDPNRPWISAFVSHLQGKRFYDPGFTPLLSPSESANLPSAKDLIASLAEFDPVKPFSTTMLQGFIHAIDPFFIQDLVDIVDIGDRIKLCEQLIASYPSHKSAPMASFALEILLERAFDCASEIKYLNRAISIARENINTADSQHLRDGSLANLTRLLQRRLAIFCYREDLDELMQLFPMVTAHQHVTSATDCPVSCYWALTAHIFGHPSASTAYDRAMSSIQASLIFAPTLDVQHSRLVAMGDRIKTLPLDYTSYQIRNGQLKQAIETLEQGRALLWSEMRGLRTSTDKLRAADSHLADKFAAVNKDLERLTLIPSPDGNVDRRNNALDGMEPFGHIVMQQRKLLDDREKLVSQIQTLPGFDTFLKPPSFNTLQSVARHGPVVIINHSKRRSDILILLQNCPPSLITSPNGFYSRANKLQDQLLRERKKGLDSNEYEDALQSVLKELYELVGRPVIKRLKELNVPEQSRVWWCPTSVFCSLPLHAMGPIPHDVGPPRYFLDLYIPSYIPSLSALIESRKPGSQADSKPSILLVAQPDETLQQAWKETKAVQAVDTQVTTLFSAKATPTTVLGNLRDHRFAHIVCHGILEPGKPFEASFKLHRGKRLPLLEIVRSQLPDAEFAFLSACHTAELTDESIADEVLHLAAAMQFCGFRSVVGTMWAMADTDGPDLARNFYYSVFSDVRQGTLHYERTAGALRDAVVKLRRKSGMTLERWVNYVHYGA